MYGGEKKVEKWMDFYKILQVHPTAEQEIIESSYKRLCRKYHPDVNKSVDALDRIKRINIAYSTLGNEESRKKYHIIWSEKNKNQYYKNQNKKSNEINIKVLEKYFYHISMKKFTEAYELISKHDKETINLEDFIKWQDTVSKVFSLENFECYSVKSFIDAELGDIVFKEVLQCETKLIENNIKSNITTSDEVTKYIVKEDEVWGVYLGYIQLQPLITKFEGLADSDLFPTALEYWLKMKDRTDEITGLPNKEGFIEKVQTEISRSKRYGNIFSIIFIKAKFLYYNKYLDIDDCIETMERILAKSIKCDIRETDILGFWDKCEFVILLQETDYDGALKVAEKLCNIPNNNDNFDEFNICVSAGVSQYDSSPIEDIISYARRKAILTFNVSKVDVARK